jgi:hypothetical protein
MPPVSTILAETVGKDTTGVVDMGGKFATNVVNTRGKFATGDLRISPQIFKKIGNDPNVIFRGLGEDDS